MRAAVYYGNAKLEIEDVPEPSAGPGQVKVKVSRNGICGTDLHEYYDGPIFIPPSNPHPLTGKCMPLVLGHEFSGVVTELGDGLPTWPRATGSRSSRSTAADSAGHARKAGTTCARSSGFTV
jgi:threonine dehydrogenase-like Zn-dependent dehydrogenase